MKENGDAPGTGQGIHTPISEVHRRPVFEKHLCFSDNRTGALDTETGLLPGSLLRHLQVAVHAAAAHPNLIPLVGHVPRPIYKIPDRPRRNGLGTLKTLAPSTVKPGRNSTIGSSTDHNHLIGFSLTMPRACPETPDLLDLLCTRYMDAETHQISMPLVEWILLMDDVIAGLCHLHRQRWRLIDAKPENFLVFESPAALHRGGRYYLRICDFDAVQHQDCLGAGPYQTMTPEYAAPEILQAYIKGIPWPGNATERKFVDRADVWSFGVVAGMYFFTTSFLEAFSTVKHAKRNFGGERYVKQILAGLQEGTKGGKGFNGGEGPSPGIETQEEPVCVPSGSLREPDDVTWMKQSINWSHVCVELVKYSDSVSRIGLLREFESTDPGVVGHAETHWPSELALWKLVKSCLQLDPQHRPSMEQVASTWSSIFANPFASSPALLLCAKLLSRKRQFLHTAPPDDLNLSSVCPMHVDNDTDTDANTQSSQTSETFSSSPPSGSATTGSSSLPCLSFTPVTPTLPKPPSHGSKLLATWTKLEDVSRRCMKLALAPAPPKTRPRSTRGVGTVAQPSAFEIADLEFVHQCALHLALRCLASTNEQKANIALSGGWGGNEDCLRSVARHYGDGMTEEARLTQLILLCWKTIASFLNARVPPEVDKLLRDSIRVGTPEDELLSLQLHLVQKVQFCIIAPLAHNVALY